MSIKIIDEPELVLKREEHQRLLREYQKAAEFTVDMPDFETWARRKKANENQRSRDIRVRLNRV